MPFFDDSHVTDVGMQGSAGPSVGFLDMVQQGYRQQFRVDSARALNTELQNRWIDSLRNLERNGGGKFNGPLDQDMYVAFAEHSQGKPISVTRMGVEGEGYGARLVPGDVTQNAYFQEMLRANEAIKKLNNPEIKTFEQILEEVSQMQQEVEGETASMSERGGVVGMLGSLIGAIGGSFTHRDPLNIVTAPIGAGRTVATRIAAEMGIAGAITGVTELTEVAPNRALAGLPKRNPLYDIAAATIGAGVIRGGIEGIGYGVGRLRGEDIDFDTRDTQLAKMFAANSDKPSARAGAMILDDAVFIERNNPFGEGRASQERFMAELQQMQRAMNGEPMTAVTRVLPPLPFEYIQKAADFEIVREQAPALYAKMEAAQVRVQELRARIDSGSQAEDAEVTPEWRVDTTPENDNIWRQPYGTRTPEGAIRSGNFSDAITWIKGNSKNESNQALAERLATLVDGVELRVFTAEEARLGQVPPRMARVHGSVLHSRGQARAFLNADTRGLDEEVILHEAIHAAVATRIGTLRNLPQKQINQAEGYGKDARRLQVISKQARKAYYERAAKKELDDISFLTRSEMQIAFDNTDEFLTYGLTNPEFQKFLDSVKSSAVDAEIKGLTLWQAFVDLLRGIIGLPKKYEAEFDRILREGTLNDQFFDTADDLFDRMDRTLPVTQTREGGDEAVAGGYSLYAKRTDESKELRQLLRKANKEYQAAYREVEAEAARLNALATRGQDTQQAEASNILAQAYGRPFIGPLLRHENVEALVDRINRINETLDEDTIALFVRQTEEGEGAARSTSTTKEAVNLNEFMVEGNERFLIYTAPDGKEADIHLIISADGRTEIAINANAKWESNQFGPSEVRRVAKALKEKYPEITEFFGGRETGANVGRTQVVAVPETWRTDGGIDIGLREPVDPNFTFATDEGEMTVAAAMRDLQDDTDLVEAIKVCAI